MGNTSPFCQREVKACLGLASRRRTPPASALWKKMKNLDPGRQKAPNPSSPPPPPPPREEFRGSLCLQGGDFCQRQPSSPRGHVRPRGRSVFAPCPGPAPLSLVFFWSLFFFVYLFVFFPFYFLFLPFFVAGLFSLQRNAYNHQEISQGEENKTRTSL